MDSRVSISQGKTVAEPLRDSKIFPPLVCSMVAVGESTGGLDTMLKKVADLYEEEVDDAVTNLTAMMEPMIMVVLGVVLGGLVVAMYLPIFQMDHSSVVNLGGPSMNKRASHGNWSTLNDQRKELAEKIRWLLLLRVIILSFFSAQRSFLFPSYRGKLRYLLDFSMPLSSRTSFLLVR